MKREREVLSPLLQFKGRSPVRLKMLVHQLNECSECGTTICGVRSHSVCERNKKTVQPVLSESHFFCFLVILG